MWIKLKKEKKLPPPEITVVNVEQQKKPKKQIKINCKLIKPC
jgi:hypothetical protein